MYARGYATTRDRPKGQRTQRADAAHLDPYNNGYSAKKPTYLVSPLENDAPPPLKSTSSRPNSPRTGSPSRASRPPISRPIVLGVFDESTRVSGKSVPSKKSAHQRPALSSNPPTRVFTSSANTRESVLPMSGQRAHEQPKPQLVAPPVQREPYKYLIPPQSSKDHNKLVVVLDLDETLVYGREGPVRVRPGTAELLQCLKDRAEVIVWTAGSRDYALEVINIIDPFCAIQHCIYRHPMWWTGEIGCTKDLNQLGRPLEKTVLIDNTPDVFRANPTNGILVSDFLGTVFKADRVLFTLADIFDFIFRRISDPTVGSIFASKRIMLRRVPLESNRKIELYTLAADDVENHMYISPAQRSLLQYLH